MLYNDEGKSTAEIENWTYDGIFLFGNVIKHNNQPSFKTAVQRTTEVLEIDFENGFAETRNTFYKLGKPLYLKEQDDVKIG